MSRRGGIPAVHGREEVNDGYTEARRALGLGDPPPDVLAAASARHLKAGALIFLNVARQARYAAAAIRQLTEQDQLETGEQ